MDADTIRKVLELEDELNALWGRLWGQHPSRRARNFDGSTLTEVFERTAAAARLLLTQKRKRVERLAENLTELQRMLLQNEPLAVSHLPGITYVQHPSGLRPTFRRLWRLVRALQAACPDPQ